ncbi:hypothetical protein ACJZ2D_007921 [Fusarium nematophilum]
MTALFKHLINGLGALFAQGLAPLLTPGILVDTPCYGSEAPHADTASALLQLAIYSQQWETCNFLFDQGADADYTPEALSDNSPRNKASDLLFQGGLGRDAAAARGDDEAVTTLLRFSANPNILDCQHAGPASYAADRNHTVCARILLAAGADPDPTIPDGHKIGSHLNCAVRNATDPFLFKILLEYGANVDACGIDGQTSLIHAARADNVEFALILLECNANINVISTAGQTPLGTAIVSNSHGVLSLLLERWDQYYICPRLVGLQLLKMTAQYADLRTVSILLQTNHLRLKHDERYSTGDFDTLLHERLDVDKEMDLTFAELVAQVRTQAAQDMKLSHSTWKS